MSFRKTALVLFCAGFGHVALYAQYPVRGGSNLVTYTAGSAPVYSTYGVISDYYLGWCTPCRPVSTVIDSLLNYMASNGQQRITIPILFSDGGGSANGQCPSSGTAGQGPTIDSSTGSIPSACLSALEAIINDAYSHGFGVRLRFLPQSVNNPLNWSSYDSVHATQNFNFITSVHNAMTSGGFYLDKYDLGNELTNALPLVEQYAHWLWLQYVSYYGSGNDTVGFSIACGSTCTTQLSAMPSIYAYPTNYPPVFELHICDGANTGADYLAAWNYLSTRGFTQGWIIGETCYNDATAAQQLYNARLSAGNAVFYLQQWPDSSFDAPRDYTNFITYGW